LLENQYYYKFACHKLKIEKCLNCPLYNKLCEGPGCIYNYYILHNVTQECKLRNLFFNYVQNKISNE